MLTNWKNFEASAIGNQLSKLFLHVFSHEPAIFKFQERFDPQMFALITRIQFS